MCVKAKQLGPFRAREVRWLLAPVFPASPSLLFSGVCLGPHFEFFKSWLGKLLLVYVAILGGLVIILNPPVTCTVLREHK